MMVLIVGDYVYGIVAIFDNVMALIGINSCASEDLVPDGLVRYTDAEGSEAVNMEIEGRSEQWSIATEILFTVGQPPLTCFCC